MRPRAARDVASPVKVKHEAAAGRAASQDAAHPDRPPGARNVPQGEACPARDPEHGPRAPVEVAFRLREVRRRGKPRLHHPPQDTVQQPEPPAHARFASIASQISRVTFRPSNRSSSWSPVGDVTLISVR